MDDVKKPEQVEAVEVEYKESIVPIGFQCECGSDALMPLLLAVKKPNVIVLLRCLDCKKNLRAEINPNEFELPDSTPAL